MAIRYRSDLPPTAELAIVGGGVAGAAVAFHAGRAGLRTVILERRPALATLTTAAAAGGVRLQLDAPQEVELVRETLDLLADFEEATGQGDHSPAVRRQGYLWVTTDEEGAVRQRALVDAQRSWGVDGVELLSGDHARRRFPHLSPDVVQARYRPDDALIDPRGLALGLAAGSGADVVTGCTVTGFRVRADRLEAVETTAGPVAAGAAVLTAGPLSGPLAEAAGLRLPVETVRRHKVVMPEVPEVPPEAPMTIDDDRGGHWRPAFSGAFLLFTDPDEPPSPPTEDVPIDHRFAFRLLDPRSPVAVARVSPFWEDVWRRGSAPWMLQAGQYVMTPDRRPLIGPSGIEGLWVNTGDSGRGVMGSVGAARRLIDAVTGRDPAAVDPYRPDRSFEERPALDPL